MPWYCPGWALSAWRWRICGQAGLDAAITTAIAEGKPFLGICLGLQLLFEESEEFGREPGLGIFRGRVVRFFPAGAPEGVKIPHMGWNSVQQQAPSPVLEGIPSGAYVYFVHSFYVVPEEPDITATTTEFGGFPFTSSVAKDNVYACQFHPEKSGALGLQLLKNFGEVAAAKVGVSS